MQSSALAHSLSTSVLPARVSIPQPRKRSRSLPRRWLSSRLVPNLLLASTNQNFLPACSGKKLSLPSDASHGNRFGVIAFFFLPPPHPCHAAKRHFRAQSWLSVKALPPHYHKKAGKLFCIYINIVTFALAKRLRAVTSALILHGA